MYRVELHSNSIVTMTMANRVLQETGTRNRFFDGVTYLSWTELDDFLSADSHFVCDIKKVTVNSTGYKSYNRELKLYEKRKGYNTGSNIKATNENEFIIDTCHQTSAEDLSGTFSMLLGA